MTLSEKALATSYAKAFDSVFAQQLSESGVQCLSDVAETLEQQKSLPFYLSLTIIPHAQKEQILRKFFAEYTCADLLDPLVKLLTQHKRLFLIGEIVRQIVIVYQERAGIVEALLKTAQPLTDEQQHFFEAYLSSSTEKRVRLTQEVDQALIAGVRIESATWLWEYSVAQQLRTIRASVS